MVVDVVCNGVKQYGIDCYVDQVCVEYLFEVGLGDVLLFDDGWCDIVDCLYVEIIDYEVQCVQIEYEVL